MRGSGQSAISAGSHPQFLHMRRCHEIVCSIFAMICHQLLPSKNCEALEGDHSYLWHFVHAKKILSNSINSKFEDF